LLNKKPLIHIVVLRCPDCKERFQANASTDGKYQCPHCDGWMEYVYHKPNPAEAKPIGPMENK
jgi:transcription initiation factor IIE alpha subunit